MPFCAALRTLKAWQKGPEIKSSQIRSVCGGHQSHGQRLRAVWEEEQIVNTGHLFSYFDQFLEKQNNS